MMKLLHLHERTTGPALLGTATVNTTKTDVEDAKTDDASHDEPVEGAVEYRDATFSKTTRDALEQVAAWLRSRNVNYEWAAAVEDVVARWDANDATAIGIEPGEDDGAGS